MRLFTAIDIPEEVKDRLKEFVQPLRSLAKENWSPIDNLHITTKFIGEWPEQRLAEMKNVLAQVPPPGAIEIAVRGIGWFPNARNPRVFWAGVEAGASLATLARVTEESVAALGVAAETRAHSPHLTLARIREQVSLGWIAKGSRNRQPAFRNFSRGSIFSLFVGWGQVH